MGIQILNKDVSVISSVMGKLKASIGSIFGTTGWAGGGGGTPASQGPLAGTPPATVDTSEGSADWTSLANLFSTTSYSTTGLEFMDNRSYYIVGKGFGFSIPTGATINGIIVTLEARSFFGEARDSSVKIVKNNIITGTNKSILGSLSISSFANRTYGGSTDLWGETWTAADINSSNFGIAYSAESMYISKSLIPVDVRNLRITVHYTT